MDRLTVIYKPDEVYFEPGTGYPYCKLGYENRRSVHLLIETSNAHTEYQLIGGTSLSSETWKALPAARSAGKYVLEVPLSRDARLLGEVTEPFALAQGQTLTIAARDANGRYVAETVTFQSASFVDISAATAAEVAAAIGAACTHTRAEALAGRVLLKSVLLDEAGYLHVSSADGVEDILGFGPDNHVSCYQVLCEERNEPSARGLSGQLTRLYVRLRTPAEGEGEEATVSDWLSDWVVSHGHES
jgi:hypothetical protein